MTIGVIDECRRYGLGTRLLLATNEVIIDLWPNCVVLYLHVIEYNNAAINFYQRNGFNRDENVIPNHYTLEDKPYAAIVFYRPMVLPTLEKR